MSWKPRCPNHGVDLTDLGFPIKPKGVGICPISGASFEYEMDTGTTSGETTVDKFGNTVSSKKWNVTGDEVKEK